MPLTKSQKERRGRASAALQYLPHGKEPWILVPYHGQDSRRAGQQWVCNKATGKVLFSVPTLEAGKEWMRFKGALERAMNEARQ